MTFRGLAGLLLLFAKLCRRPPGDDAAAEGPVEVVAAAAAGAVQRLAHEVESRTALELEIVLYLVQKQAAAGGLSLLPAAGRQAIETPALGRGGEFRPRGGGQGAGVFR